ncbi:MAG: YkgJ family cysteine cluster protein [Pseudomonadota bacterium]
MPIPTKESDERAIAAAAAAADDAAGAAAGEESKGAAGGALPCSSTPSCRPAQCAGASAAPAGGGKREDQALKDDIINNFPRLTRDARFKFDCHKSISCFNTCCRDVNIVLTPYDALRLRKRLGLSSHELLLHHTIQPFNKDQKLPVVLLKMTEDANKSCPFVSEEGCTVYEDRPWACRMYPVGLASSKTSSNQYGEEFYFVLDEDHCRGGDENREWSIAQWLDDQKVADYDRMGDLFKEVTLHPRLLRGEALEPQKMEMYFMACYDLDRMRRFVFGSSFLDRFEVEGDVVERLRTDEEALLAFSFRWLQFCLFGDPTMKPKAEVLEACKQSKSASTENHKE